MRRHLLPAELRNSKKPMSFQDVSTSLTDYYRCPKRFVPFATSSTPSVGTGYFRFGQSSVCFGENQIHAPAITPKESLYDASMDCEVKNGTIYLSFDPRTVIANLYCESYVGEWRSGAASVVAKLYYLLRPLLSVSVRRRLQKFHLRKWREIPFPQWPVDCSVDNLLEELLLLAVKNSGGEPIPFIWFWPEGYSACALMTHDVETTLGRDFCGTLMDIDEAFGIKASIQVVPEVRYSVSPEFLTSIKERGFEVVVHDLNHDGHLYKDRDQFLKRAVKINSYLKEYGSEGFRAAVLYRKQLWYDALKCSYDMSVPNVAHLDPQRGGCCTVMPYFLGDIVELPVTTVQDYTLFNILEYFSINLWKEQTEIILNRHGLMSFIIHPDYIIESRQTEIYKSLLAYLNQLRQDEGLWITTPGEVNRWWRERAAMELVETSRGWVVHGAGSERACIAWASEVNGRLKFSIESKPTAAA